MSVSRNDKEKVLIEEDATGITTMGDVVAAVAEEGAEVGEAVVEVEVEGVVVVGAGAVAAAAEGEEVMTGIARAMIGIVSVVDLLKMNTEELYEVDLRIGSTAGALEVMVVLLALMGPWVALLPHHLYRMVVDPLLHPQLTPKLLHRLRHQLQMIVWNKLRRFNRFVAASCCHLHHTNNALAIGCSETANHSCSGYNS